MRKWEVLEARLFHSYVKAFLEREIIIIIADHKTYGVETIEVKMPKEKSVKEAHVLGSKAISIK